MPIKYVLLPLFSILMLVSTGCKKQAADGETASEKAPEPGTEDEKKVEEPADGKPAMANEMKNCPSSVEGSETKLEKSETELVFKITTDDKSKVAEIQTRAKHLASVSGKDNAKVKHSGEGTGSAELGKCPVAIANAKASVKDISRGVKISLTPADKDVERLYALANDRMRGGARKGRSGGHGGGGQGKGEGGGKGEGDSKTDAKDAKK